MDATKLVTPLGVCALGLGGYYLVRPLSNPWVRGVLASVSYAAFTAYACKDLPSGSMGSMMTATLCWLASIRLTHLMVLPDEERRALTLRDFMGRYLWFLFPVSENPLPRQGAAWLKHLDAAPAYHSGLFLAKLVASSWIHRWLTYGLEQVGGGDVVRQSYALTLQYSALFGLSVCLGTWSNELQIGLVSLVTRDRYQVQAFNNWPVLAASPREFWGGRYNLLVGTLLHESVFTPLRKQAGVSAPLAALAAFAVSGALHAHVALLCFGESPARAFLFFAIHGAACALERYVDMRKHLPRPVAIGLTQAFVLATAPLYPAMFVYHGPAWQHENAPLPLPSFLTLPIPSFYPH